MSPAPDSQLRLSREVCQWWKDNRSRDGYVKTLRRLVKVLSEFVRDSTPERRRQRYGDVDYDWDYRVDTTGATVQWRSRLLGLFHSPYQPTEPVLFHEILGSLAIDFHDFTFIDIGSGKGRALLMAANYPFRRILGIELFPELHSIAQENIKKYTSDSQQCFTVESICGNASEFTFPPEPAVVYLFNPLPESGLIKLVANLEKSLRENLRPLYLLYHTPQLEPVLARSTALKKLLHTHQFSTYRESAS